MDAEQLGKEIQRIAGLLPVEHEPEIQKLREVCKTSNYPQRVQVLRKLVEEATLAAATAMGQEAASKELKKANDEFFVVSTSSKTRIGSFDVVPINGHTRRQLNMQTKADFELRVMNRGLVGGVEWADWWLRHPQRREYTGFFMDPDGPAELGGKLNLWDGFGVEATPGDATMFTDYVHEVLAAGKHKVSEYILNWLAWVVQNPSKRAEVVLGLVSSREGTGKGSLGNLMCTLFGQHGFRAGKSEQLTGKFNRHLMDALFVFADEALFAGSNADADTLKGIITEPTISVEAKFQDELTVDNRMSIMMATNHDWAANIGWSDRRYAVYEVSDHRAKDHAYWEQYHAWLNKGGKEVVLHYLLSRDVSAFSPKRDRELTEVYYRQRIATLRGAHKWWYRFVMDRRLTLGKVREEDRMLIPKDGMVLKTDMYAEYESWHRRTGESGRVEDAARFFKAGYAMLGKSVEPKRLTVEGAGRAQIVFLPISDEGGVDWGKMVKSITKYLDS